MTASQRRKGHNNERSIVTWLRARGRPHIERRLSGANGDTGDLTGWPGVVIEAKNCARLDLAGWITQLENEIDQAQADTGAVVIKRRGTTDPGQYYALMTLDRWETLMREAGR